MARYHCRTCGKIMDDDTLVGHNPTHEIVPMMKLESISVPFFTETELQELEGISRPSLQDKAIKRAIKQMRKEWR